MAERRMFTKKIVDSDAFLDMPLSAQCLYFHLNMRADDQGVVDNPKKIMRMIGASEGDMQMLVAKRFLLVIEHNLIVIKHWWMHNYLRKDRYHPSQYQDELKVLGLKENGAYTEAENLLTEVSTCDGNQMATTCKPDGNQMATEVIDRDRDRVRVIDKDIDRVTQQKRTGFIPPSVEDVRAYCTERHNNVNAERFVDFYSSKGWMVGKNKMKDWKAAVRTWEKRDNESVGANGVVLKANKDTELDGIL